MKRLVPALLFAFAFACASEPSEPSEDPPTGEELAGEQAMGFMQSSATEMCDEGLVCWTFDTKGDICTRSCVTAADCPAPSTGCNDKGVCKAP